MNREELLSTNELYDKKKGDWEFYEAAYKGAKALVDWGVLRQFEADPVNFRARKAAAFGFNYTKRIVDVMSDFLREAPFIEEYGSLNKDASWKMFVNDCDLFGTNWSNFWSLKRRWASIYGHCGIFVDKASGPFETVAEEIANGVYPYLAYYSPLHILDWAYKRDPTTNRPALVYLKLFEDDGSVRIWDLQEWEVWVIPKDTSEEPFLEKTGANTLGKIPFAWFANGQDVRNVFHSVSDVADISLIDASLIRDASSADEIITNAAFPMLALPKEPLGDGGDNSAVEVGPTRILEFDSEGARPAWLESKVLDSISAILKFWEKKSDEMYGMANLSALREIAKSKERRSGDSLKETFRFLNTSLSEKVDSEIETRLLCMKYWMEWQGMGASFNDMAITHEKKFNAERLILSIKDAVEAEEAVQSEFFSGEIRKLIVKRTLPGITGEQISVIEAEIKKSLVAKTVPSDV